MSGKRLDTLRRLGSVQAKLVQLEEARLARCDAERRTLIHDQALTNSLISADGASSERLIFAAMRKLDETGQQIARNAEERSQLAIRLKKLKLQEKAIGEARDAESGRERRHDEAKELTDITESWLALQTSRD